MYCKAKDLEAHLQGCVFRLLGCENSGCVFEGTLKNLGTHAGECPHRLVACANLGCPGCKIHEREAHPPVCEYRLVCCPNAGCSKEVSAKDLPEHGRDCGFRLVQCTFDPCFQKLRSTAKIYTYTPLYTKYLEYSVHVFN